jgi:LacI family transcriptional regulator
MKQRTKQVDVAKLAGVSRSTVSIVLSGLRNNRVPISESTRVKVLDAARKLGYVPNVLARSLRSGSSQTVGFLMPTTQNPHYWEILAGAEEEITARGYHLSLAIANLNPERELNCLRSLAQQRLDGVIVIPTFLEKINEEMGDNWAWRTPVVITQPVKDADWVFFDFRRGDEQVMDHLISMGHHRIGLIDGGARLDIALVRQTVYKTKLAAVNIPLDDLLLCRCGNLPDEGYQVARGLLDLSDPPTAIWAVNDLIAIGVLRAVYESGRRVPEDVAVVGYDNTAVTELLYPPLTTVNIPARQLGRRAAQILFRRLENPNADPIQETIPVNLVIRQSTNKVLTIVQP